jgi:hypothetical protein
MMNQLDKLSPVIAPDKPIHWTPRIPSRYIDVPEIRDFLRMWDQVQHGETREVPRGERLLFEHGVRARYHFRKYALGHGLIGGYDYVLRIIEWPRRTITVTKLGGRL